jgi:hypothetical protein
VETKEKEDNIWFFLPTKCLCLANLLMQEHRQQQASVGQAPTHFGT